MSRTQLNIYSVLGGKNWAQRLKLGVHHPLNLRMLVTQLCLTLQTHGAYQAPPFMEFSLQGYQRGQPLPSSRDPFNPGIKPGSPTLQVDSLLSEPPGKPSHHLIVATKVMEYDVVIYKIIQIERRKGSKVMDYSINSFR